MANKDDEFDELFGEDSGFKSSKQPSRIKKEQECNSGLEDDEFWEEVEETVEKVHSTPSKPTEGTKRDSFVEEDEDEEYFKTSDEVDELMEKDYSDPVFHGKRQKRSTSVSAEKEVIDLKFERMEMYIQILATRIKKVENDNVQLLNYIKTVRKSQLSSTSVPPSVPSPEKDVVEEIKRTPISQLKSEGSSEKVQSNKRKEEKKKKSLVKYFIIGWIIILIYALISLFWNGTIKDMTGQYFDKNPFKSPSVVVDVDIAQKDKPVVDADTENLSEKVKDASKVTKINPNDDTLKKPLPVPTMQGKPISYKENDNSDTNQSEPTDGYYTPITNAMSDEVEKKKVDVTEEDIGSKNILAKKKK